MVYTAIYVSPLGRIMLAGKDETISGLWLEGQKYFAATLQRDVQENAGLPIFIQAKKWLDAYFSGKKPAISELQLAPEGSEFRKAVWDVLCQIPYGQCMTYGEIARMIANKMGKERMSSQAVGGAVGHNPISIIIPCHRVIGHNGSLTGYAAGIHTKIKLLALEGMTMTHLFVPRKGTAL